MTFPLRLGRHASAAEIARTRAAAFRALRSWFEERGSIELDVPPLAPSAGQETHLHPPRVAVEGLSDALWLQTSPELAMKRMIMAGLSQVHSLGFAFRGGREELSDLHQPQFTMLEWYRPGASIDDLQSDVMAIVDVVAEAVGCPVPSTAGAWSVKELAHRVGLDLDPLLDGDAAGFARAARARGLGCADGDDADSLLSRVLVERIEPLLHAERGLAFLHGYPAFAAALAELDPTDERVALRVEAWLGGVELANGYVELRDPAEHRRRWRHEAALRSEAAPPVDETFLDELEQDGLPRTVGMALGVDRLIMVLTGKCVLRDVLPLHLEPLL